MLQQLNLLVVLLVIHLSCAVAFQTPAFLAQPTMTRGGSSQHNSQSAAEMTSHQENSPTLDQRQTSLISSFLVDISKGEDNTDIWSLTPIEDIVSEDVLSSGAKSWKALHSTAKEVTKPTITLKSSDTSASDHDELLSVLSRIMAQSTASTTGNDATQQSWNLKICLEEGNEEFLSDVKLFSIEGIQQLFGTDSTTEIVDMVDSAGEVLGMVPRTLVHSWNILHRGIGLTVSKDADFSELYVHRRTDFKRIFPSMCDMFVGGVSGSGEDSKLTAAREVAEELGLSRALEETNNALSDPLFTCVVCTSYNRCVVTVFQYTMDPSVETVSWQEEEVSWGEFVPYNIVEAAADLSIQRLVSNKEWPGKYPAIQSKWKGSQPPDENFATEGSEDWTTWDFVPDGLLVWEAWLQWRDNQ